jgi:predicted RNase H-like nuclease (RuvC/YqgF family)
LTDEVQRLKRKNEALEYQLESKQYELRRLTSKVNKIEHHLPTEIVEYDYDAIKERLDPIRDELNIVQRTFRRIIHAQYKVPIAVLVGKN